MKHVRVNQSQKASMDAWQDGNLRIVSFLIVDLQAMFCIASIFSGSRPCSQMNRKKDKQIE